jgi:hypothetical protein
MGKPFVPIDFKIPEKLETKLFKLRKLTVNDAEKDFDAIISSIGHLKNVFGPGSEWPPENLTVEQNRAYLLQHQKESEERIGFAYTVMNSNESRCLGCVYIYPPQTPEFDAVVFLWVRKGEFETGLDAVLFKAVKEWVKAEWPFKKVAYPNRETIRG